jgi:hypothetical protein
MGRLSQNRSSGCQNLILVDALFLLYGGRRREGKKKEKEKNHHRERGLDSL